MLSFSRKYCSTKTFSLYLSLLVSLPLSLSLSLSHISFLLSLYPSLSLSLSHTHTLSLLSADSLEALPGRFIHVCSVFAVMTFREQIYEMVLVLPGFVEFKIKNRTSEKHSGFSKNKNEPIHLQPAESLRASERSERAKSFQYNGKISV